MQPGLQNTKSGLSNNLMSGATVSSFVNVCIFNGIWTVKWQGDVTLVPIDKTSIPVDFGYCDGDIAIIFI